MPRLCWLGVDCCGDWLLESCSTCSTAFCSANIDASGMLSPAEARRADVLNGIAYKPDSNTFLLTGKLWPHVFEVELVSR